MSSVTNPRPMAKADIHTIGRVRLRSAFQLWVELSAPRANAAVTTHASGSKNIPRRIAQGLGIRPGNERSTKASRHPNRSIAMPKRTGARTISCSVIETHRIRNGFSTSRGFSVWLTHIPIVRSRSSISGSPALRRTCRESKDVQRAQFGPAFFCFAGHDPMMDIQYRGAPHQWIALLVFRGVRNRGDTGPLFRRPVTANLNTHLLNGSYS